MARLTPPAECRFLSPVRGLRKRFFPWLFLLALVVATGLPAADPTVPAGAWPYAGDGLQPAPEWHWGQLKNGLRYVVRSNAQPAGHVSLRLCVQVGYAQENRDEHGFAHFVEHMAFRGTTHFPNDTLIPELAREGLALGPEVSAFTFLTYTIYQLDVPSAEPADITRGLLVLRDVADGISFESKLVKKERGVIASEYRDRTSPSSRTEEVRRQFLYPATALDKSFFAPVKDVSARELARFYDKWYRPEKMLVVAVGDADPGQLEGLVQKQFASLRSHGAAPPAFDPGVIDNPPDGRTWAHNEPEVGMIGLEIVSVRPNPGVDSREIRRQWLARQMVLYMINARFQRLLRNNSDRLKSGYASSLVATPYSIETSLGVTTLPRYWRYATETLEQELRRSFIFTFPANEIREARASVLTAFEQQARERTTARSPDLAGRLVGEILWHVVCTSPEDDLRAARETLPQLDALELNQAWRSLWQEHRARIFAFGFVPSAGADAAITAAFNLSLRQPISPPENKPDQPFAYTDFGPPGKIVHQELLPQTDIHLLQFANGVRANLKRTNFEAAKVYLTVRLGQGLLTEPQDQPGLGELASAVFVPGGLGKHPPDELRHILADRAASLQFQVREDCFAFYGSAAPADLLRLLQLVAAYLTDPGWNPATYSQAVSSLGLNYSSMEYTPEGVLGQNVFRILAGNESRYAHVGAGPLGARSLAEVKAWLTPQLKGAPIEIGLVGDFDVDQATAALSATLGALTRSGDAAAATRPFHLGKAPGEHQLTVLGREKRAGVEVIWPLDHCEDVHLGRQLSVLGDILSDRLRLKLREEMGAIYTPSVDFWNSEASPHDGYMQAYISTRPEDAAKLARLVVELADQLARKGVTPDEFTQAREPMLKRTELDLKDNSYWLNYIVAKVQSVPEAREWALTRISDFRDMTRAEIDAAAVPILPKARAIVFTALPLGYPSH
jgi:zinc protease